MDALRAFEDNIDDAERLIALARVMTNERQRRMRSGLRERFGSAMGIPKKFHHAIDCVESADAFIVLKPGGRSSRANFTEAQLRPLLRQSIVAAGAAVETYVADKACGFVNEALRMRPMPRRLQLMPLTFAELRDADEYARKGWAYKRLIGGYLAEQASADPAKIGIVFSTVGRRGIWPPVDACRGLTRGTSEKQLKQLADRRNLIAHTGDRKGRGRRPLSMREACRLVGNARSIVEAMDVTIT